MIRIDDETYVTAALITTCGSNRVHFAAPSPLADATARKRALDLAQARGGLQEAFAERLLADPALVRARVRHTVALSLKDSQHSGHFCPEGPSRHQSVRASV